QFVDLADDPGHGDLMLGVLLASGVPGHHAEQRRALGGEQRGHGAAAGGGDTLGELVQEVADLLVTDGHVSSGRDGAGLRPPRSSHAAWRGPVTRARSASLYALEKTESDSEIG